MLRDDADDLRTTADRRRAIRSLRPAGLRCRRSCPSAKHAHSAVTGTQGHIETSRIPCGYNLASLTTVAPALSERGRLRVQFGSVIEDKADSGPGIAIAITPQRVRESTPAGFCRMCLIDKCRRRSHQAHRDEENPRRPVCPRAHEIPRAAYGQRRGGHASSGSAKIQCVCTRDDEEIVTSDRGTGRRNCRGSACAPWGASRRRSPRSRRSACSPPGYKRRAHRPRGR